MALLPPPPTVDATGSFAWLEWFRQLRNYITQVGSVPWSIINFAGSKISDIADTSHQTLDSLQGGTAGQYYHLTQTKYNTVANLDLTGTSGTGVKVDTNTPTYPWHDLLGSIGVKTAGATDPVWSVYRGSIYAYTFDTATAEAFFTFHIPHDFLPSQASMLIHMHWSQIVVDTGGTAGAPGNVEWKFDISYADGHGTAGGAADPFIAPITVTVVQQGSTTQYGHMIAEVEFANLGGTGGKLDTATIQVDGLLLVRAYRIKANAADTLNQAPFGHTCDIHYQSTGIGTKNKSPNFYV